MALAQPEPQPEETPGPTVTLRPDPLLNWSDLIVLGFAIIFTGYLALGESLAIGRPSGSLLWNSASIFGVLAVGLLLMGWRRFRRVRLIVGDDQIEAISVWGIYKSCRLAELTEVTEEGRPLNLVFKTNGDVAFKVSRNLWTRMQLRTLETFLDLPVPGASGPTRAGGPLRIATVCALALDAIFLAVGGTALVEAYRADSAAHAYQRATSACFIVPSTTDFCYVYQPLVVNAIADPSGDQYPMRFTSAGPVFISTVLMKPADRDKFLIGMPTYAKLWRGHLTLIAIDDQHWLRTTDNPYYVQQSFRTGPPILVVAFLALVPLLRRLHPIVT